MHLSLHSDSTQISKRSSSKSNPLFPNPFALEPDYWSEPQELNELLELELSEADRAKLSTRGYKTGQFFGGGTFSEVYHANYYKMLSAVKAIYKWSSVEINELYILKHIKHSHVVQLFDLYITDQRRLLIFMELLQGGSMRDYLFKLELSNNFLNKEQVRHYYMYMHGLGFAHRDQNADNILLDGLKQVCKIADFGMAKRIYHPETGEINYDQSHYSDKTDIHFLGRLLEDMLRGNENLSWQICQLLDLHEYKCNQTCMHEILSTEPWFKMKL